MSENFPLNRPPEDREQKPIRGSLNMVEFWAYVYLFLAPMYGVLAGVALTKNKWIGIPVALVVGLVIFFFTVWVAERKFWVYLKITRLPVFVCLLLASYFSGRWFVEWMAVWI